MSTLKVTHLQNESNSAPSISISSAVGGGVTFAGISTFHNHIQIGASIGRFDSSGLIKTAHGTEASPSHTFINDPDNGMYRPTTNTIGFSCAGSEKLRLDSSGRLLLGTNLSYGSANSDDLTIGDRTQSEVGITLGATVASAIRFADAGNVSAGMIQYVHNSGGTDYLNFYTNGANERLRITAAGNVGINKIAPADRLHVGGKIRFGNNSTYYGVIEHEEGVTGANIYTSADSGGHIFKKSTTTQAEINDTGIKLPAGAGINFSAYATSGNPSSNLLDDYEEGTWTPSGSYTFTHATYTKIGRQVFCQFTCTNPSGMGNISLPFAPSNTVTGSGGSEQVRYVGDAQIFVNSGGDSSTYKYVWQGNIGASMYLHKLSSAGTQAWTATFGSNVTQVTMSLNYIVS